MPPQQNPLSATDANPLELTLVRAGQDLPAWADRATLVAFLHEYLKPYQDTLPDIGRGLDDALGNRPGPGGFVLLARRQDRLVGALVMLRTGMKGYIPENLLLFVAVDGEQRGQGIGAALVREALAHCEGAVKLHVEHDNPARHLYERLGFHSKYLEMRFSKPEGP